MYRTDLKSISYDKVIFTTTTYYYRSTSYEKPRLLKKL